MCVCVPALRVSFPTNSRQSVNFKRQAREIKRSYWAKNVKVMVLCFLIVVAIVYVVLAHFCGMTIYPCGGGGK